MGGCTSSKIRENEEEVVVGICKERKRLIKLVAERRYALADSHCRYFHSLQAVSAAINLFVARHSASPFLITFPPPKATENVITNPVFLHQKPTKEAISPLCGSSHSSEEEDEVEEEVGCGYSFYMATPPPMPSPQGGFGWDFFNPFFGVNSDEVLRMVKEEEGIPDLEEEDDDDVKENVNMVCEEEEAKPVNCNGDVGEAEKGSPSRGKELLDALKDIEDHFIMAYESGNHVSRLLEANKIPLTSGLEEIKENSTKLVKAITWHGFNIARSSSCKSLAASISNNTSSWIEYKNELFDGYGGISGSHSLTLGKLNAWEKKLYQEVKNGDTLRKRYEKKCSRLRRKDVRGVSTNCYSQIVVTMRRVELISERIQKLITEEMQPQIIELLQGLAESWKVMLECHETQKMIISQVKTYEHPSFRANSHRLATLQLEAEIQNWNESFQQYIAAQRFYIEALHAWLSKFMVVRVNGPPLYTLCHDWLSAMESLPEKGVSVAMERLLKEMKWVQQGEEEEQTRRVEKITREVDDERKVIEYKLDLVESMRERVEMEKERHHRCKRETERMILNGFSRGFGFIFESLVQFSETSSKMYNELVFSSQNLGSCV